MRLGFKSMVKSNGKQPVKTLIFFKKYDQ